MLTSLPVWPAVAQDFKNNVVTPESVEKNMLNGIAYGKESIRNHHLVVLDIGPPPGKEDMIADQMREARGVYTQYVGDVVNENLFAYVDANNRMIYAVINRTLGPNFFRETQAAAKEKLSKEQASQQGK